MSPTNEDYERWLNEQGSVEETPHQKKLPNRKTLSEKVSR